MRDDVELARGHLFEVLKIARQRLHLLRDVRHFARRVERQHLERVRERLELAPLDVLELERVASLRRDQLGALLRELLAYELGHRDGDDVALGRLLEFVARECLRVVLGRDADVLLAQGLACGVRDGVA
jgi:hypothetical protein